jgi:hypothetical protein
MIDLKNNRYQIFDDLVSKDTQDYIEENLLDSNQFPWFYNENSVNDYEDDFGLPFYDYMQFAHAFVIDKVPNSAFKVPILDRLLNELNVKQTIIRAKANLKPICPYGDLEKHNRAHRDQHEDHFVGLYYVNESDGDTWLFNDDKTVMTRIRHKRGRMVFFDGQILHAASHPYYAKKRISINIDFKK